jgi:hypothetical protein
MKTHAKIQKIIAVVMIFIIMIEFTGCYSTRTALSSDIKSSEICFIHGQKINYQLSDAVISDGILSGKVSSDRTNQNSKHLYKDRINKNNIYISSDSVARIENNILSIPVGSITKIEQQIPDPGKTKKLKTALIVGCSALTILGIISTILMINAANKAADTATNAANGCLSTQPVNGSTTSTTFCSP